jgi:putative peptide zinc metalloprotease protein
MSTQPHAADTQPVPGAQNLPPEASAAPGDGHAPATGEPPPRLAEGVELVGRFEDSGYKEPPYIARRADGQMIQLPHLLYLIAERADGTRSYEQIARDVTEAFGRGLEAEDVRMLAEKKLRPLGVLARADGSSPEVKKADPFLALKLRKALVPQPAVRAITTVFRPLFWPPVILAVLAGLVAFDAWFFFNHGVAETLRQLLYQPLYLVLAFVFIVASAAFHESGHATACRYGGAEPGVMGAGIYIVWPAFYTDVTDAYRLGKGGRLRTDFGGVYFNAIFILAMSGIFFATGFEPLLFPVLLAHMEIFRQLLPLLRLDGYYVLADLTGVPDLFARIKPILVSFIPFTKRDKRVKELKPWVRVVVTLWVLIFVPFLAINITYILIYAPRIFATGWDSFLTHLDKTRTAFSSGQGWAGTAGVIQLIALSLPAAGIAFGFGRSGVKVSRGVWRKTDDRPMARAVSILIGLVALGALAWTWWPDQDYRPIQPGERFTVTDAVAAVEATAQGRPAFGPSGADTGPGSSPGTESGATGGATDQAPGSITVTPTPGTSPTASPDASVSPSPQPTVTATSEPSPTPAQTTSPSP